MTDPVPLLRLLEGDWRLTMSVWSEDGQLTRSDGLRARKRLIADGRYLREEIEGAFAGGPHEKLTVLGYNATRGRFEYVTADNHDAVLLLYLSAAGVRADATSVELWAEYAAPREGDGADFVLIRTEIISEGADRHVLRNHYRPGGGPERPFLEYVYARDSVR